MKSFHISKGQLLFNGTMYMTPSKKFNVIALSLSLALIAIQSSATEILWDFNEGTLDYYGTGNRFTVEGHATDLSLIGTIDTGLQLSAWSDTGGSDDNIIQKATVHDVSTYGIGIVNKDEDRRVPEFAIDNISGDRDFLLLSFDTPVSLTGLSIGWSREYKDNRTTIPYSHRADISIAAYTGMQEPSLEGTSSLSWIGFDGWGSQQVFHNVSDYSFQNVVSDIVSKYWAVGALSFEENDAFLLTGILAENTRTNQPSLPITDQKDTKTLEQSKYDLLVANPLGELKLWAEGEFVSITEDVKAQFDQTSDTYVLTHGWNGVFSENTSLDDKWVQDYAKSLDDNLAHEINILAYDWKEAANTTGDKEEYLKNETAAAFLRMYPEAVNDCWVFVHNCKKTYGETEDFKGLEAALERRYDSIAPNTEIVRQGLNLAKELNALIDSDQSNIRLAGHSLGAGVSTYAALALSENDKLKNSVVRLTLFDPPERGVAKIIEDTVNLHIPLETLRSKLPTLAIENIVGVDAITAFGEPYVSASNIQTQLGHSGVPNEFYKETIDFDADPETWRINHPNESAPENIGYLASEESVFDFMGTTCTVGNFVNSTLDTFVGSGDCYGNTPYYVDPVQYLYSLGTHGDFLAYSEGVNGYVNIVNGLPELVTGSPTYAYADYLIGSDVFGMSVDLLPLIWNSDDQFGIWIGDSLIFMLDAVFFNENGNWTGVLDVSQWAGEEVSITFGLLSEESGHSIAVQDVRFVSILNTVPEPSSIALILIGIAASVGSLCGRRLKAI